ncbi:MAG TPA: tetratricopeptide repeat protein [Blastocatellia bacterium]|nr:tetratricopeptide repeat protein [Blastocatellia bacterium]
MKRCPQCNKAAADDILNFCRGDGARLVVDIDSFSDRSTVVLVYDAPVAKTSPIDDPAINQRESTSPREAPKATSNNRNLLVSAKRLALAVIASIVSLTLSGTAFYSLSPGNSTAISSLASHYLLARNNNVAISSLAVLPFINVNADQQLDYLSDGMTEMLICNLSQLPILNVKARSSVFRYKGKDVTPYTVGKDLNVQAVLNGRIVLFGDVLTLSLELADASTENVIWSAQYSRKQTDLVALQSEIARDVSNKLRVKLAGADEHKLSKKYTTDTEAYQLYLKGRFYWNKRTLKDLERALDYFNQAIALDPNFALAYAGRADTYVVLPFYNDQPIREAMAPAREAALKALLLDSDLAEPHATLGQVYMQECNFAAAEREYKRTMELDPNYATAHQWFGVLLFYLGRHEESFDEFRQALEIDPLSLIINLDYAESLYNARRYDEAIAQLKKTLELNTEFATTYQRFTKFYQAVGDYDEAARSYATYRELNGDRSGAALIRDSFEKGGWPGCLRALTAKDQVSKLSRYEAVEFFAALGEKDQAFAELDKSYEVFGPILRIEPLLDPLRNDPRFREILRRAGLS